MQYTRRYRISTLVKYSPNKKMQFAMEYMTILHIDPGQPARWRSGESVRFVVGRPEVYSLSRGMPKDF